MDIKVLKTLNSFLFFANKEKGNTITRLKLMKLLWLSDRIHLNKYGRLILKDSYNALPHGPVPSQALNYSNNSIVDYFIVSGQNIKAQKDFDANYFSKSDLEVMNLVWNEFGSMSASQLRNLSHKFPEWLRYKKELEDELYPNSYEIVTDDFFKLPKNQKIENFVSIEELEDSKSHYRVHHAIQSNLNK